MEISGFYYLEMQKKLINLLKNNNYNIVQVELPKMAQNFDKSFYKENRSLKILVDYDISFIPYLRNYHCEKKKFLKLKKYIDYRMHRFFALKTWNQFDRLVVMSEVDRRKVNDILPELSVHVIPNGVDLASFRPFPKEEGDNRLLFLGGAGHFPNVDALFYFLKEIFPEIKKRIKKFSVVVIGDCWNRYSDQLPHDASIEFTGFVKDIRQYINDSTVLITPIRIGGGTRLKIVEAMALKVPVVSTSVGCEGFSVEDGQHILLADKPDDFAIKVQEVFSNKQLYNTLTENAYKLVKENYGWDKLVLKLEDIYEYTTEERKMQKAG
ncbi:glycosyl transferase, group 1 [Candidatus Scalindua japonica]|uniref:Glycosyl transferase, group 1 n=2 Tax=Candidatus Scalindua japonica TaxID=1284222 RepID=A0A286TTJ3_9BACT|nr:glycosyl transferase, group 1 [Candidatus Scalindua japonica]